MGQFVFQEDLVFGKAQGKHACRKENKGGNQNNGGGENREKGRKAQGKGKIVSFKTPEFPRREKPP
jgi:hypothetical protein